jgi:hypothetical protein
LLLLVKSRVSSRHAFPAVWYRTTDELAVPNKAGIAFTNIIRAIERRRGRHKKTKSASQIAAFA